MHAMPTSIVLCPEDVWDTAQVGFMAGLNPQYYTAEQATANQSFSANPTILSQGKCSSLPPCLLQPSASLNTIPPQTHTQPIETEKSNGVMLSNVLKKVGLFRDSLDFIPFRMKTKNPKAFANVISHQCQTIANNYTIILQNIGTEAMYYLSDYIRSMDGVLDLMPAKTVDINGNYRVLLVHKDNFRQVRRALMIQNPEWFESQAAIYAQPREGAFPGDQRHWR